MSVNVIKLKKLEKMTKFCNTVLLIEHAGIVTDLDLYLGGI
jgi:hypothetical protein